MACIPTPGRVTLKIGIVTEPWRFFPVSYRSRLGIPTMERDETREQLMSDGLDRIETAGRFLGISRSRVYELMDAGELKFVKIGRSRRIPRRALIEFAA